MKTRKKRRNNKGIWDGSRNEGAKNDECLCKKEGRELSDRGNGEAEEEIEFKENRTEFFTVKDKIFFQALYFIQYRQLNAGILNYTTKICPKSLCNNFEVVHTVQFLAVSLYLASKCTLSKK
jgi:hypothetical protein